MYNNLTKGITYSRKLNNPADIKTSQNSHLEPTD